MSNGKVLKLWRFCLIFMFLTLCKVEKIRFISWERPVVIDYNKKYILFLNVTARRYSRDDPKYYVSGHANTLIPIDNNVLVDIYFYKALGSMYKRTFFELHYRMCDLLDKDTFFGSFIKRGSFKDSCPIPAGEYHVENCTIPVERVPATLPFKKGRIFTNLTYVTGERLSHGYIDIEIKEKHVRERNLA